MLKYKIPQIVTLIRCFCIFLGGIKEKSLKVNSFQRFSSIYFCFVHPQGFEPWTH